MMRDFLELWLQRGDIRAARRVAEALNRIQGPCRDFEPAQRDIINGILAAAINEVYPSTPPESANLQAEALRRDGLLRLPDAISRDQAKVIGDFFARRTCYNGHMAEETADQVARDPAGNGGDFHFGSYRAADILTSPYLLEVFTRRDVLDLAEAYLGARPRLYSVNVYWSFPHRETIEHVQDFHRDKECSRIVVLFLYLTDVDEGSGAHQYILKTHRRETLAPYLTARNATVSADDIFRLPRDGYGAADLYQRHIGGLAEVVCGPAGTTFVEDGYGLHRGLAPTTRPRLMAWGRYGLFTEDQFCAPGGGKVQRKLLGDRYPRDERSRYALRGIVTE